MDVAHVTSKIGKKKRAFSVGMWIKLIVIINYKKLNEGCLVYHLPPPADISIL